MATSIIVITLLIKKNCYVEVGFINNVLLFLR